MIVSNYKDTFAGSTSSQVNFEPKFELEINLPNAVNGEEDDELSLDPEVT